MFKLCSYFSKRMKQENCSEVVELLSSFRSCRSLAQLSLIISPGSLVVTDERDFFNAVFQVATCLRRLIALFLCFPISSSECSHAKQSLLKLIQPIRPAFCVDIKVILILFLYYWPLIIIFRLIFSPLVKPSFT